MPYFIYSFLIFFVSCTNIQPSKEAVKFNKIDQDSVLRFNDTICTPLPLKFDSVKGLDFCYVRFGDSSGRSNLNYLYTSGKTSKLYNVEPEESQDLNYQLKGDTIEIKIFYGTHDRRYLIEPDSILFKNGIIYLKERASIKSRFPKTYGITLDEVVYKFLSKDGYLPRFRHIWELAKGTKTEDTQTHQVFGNGSRNPVFTMGTFFKKRPAPH